MIRMYRREFGGKDSSGRPLQLSFYTIRKKKCNLCIQLPDATCCRHKEKYELHPDYQDMDFHRRSYLVFYCGHGGQG